MASTETTDPALVTGRRWLTTRVPEAARRALLGAFACVVGANAGDRDVAWGLAFLRALASEAYLDLPPGAADDVEMLATGAWPEGEIPRHCFVGGSAGEWAERWTPDDRADDDDPRERPTRTASSSPASPTRTPWARCLRELLAAFVEHHAYAANVRAALRGVARAADVPWRTLLDAEDRLAGALRAAKAADEASRADEAESTTTAREDPTADETVSAVSTTGENRTGATTALAKWLQVGGAATLGGVALVLTGGLAAPALVGTLTALGATGGIIGAAAGGVAATVAAMGGAVGVAVMFGGAGAGLAGYKMARRTTGLTEFSFEPLRGEDDGLGVVIYAPGFHVLRHRLRDPAAFAFAAEANPANVFGCWGGEESEIRAVFVRPVRIGWTVRDVPDDRGVNHATVVRVVPGSPAEAAGINVGAVVEEMLTPEGLEWPVACAEDCDAMADRRPLMVRLRRCAPVVSDAETAAAGAFGGPFAWDDDGGAFGSGGDAVIVLGGETMFVDRFAFAGGDDDDDAIRRRTDARRARRERADREARQFRAPRRKRLGESSSRMLRLETGFEEENGGGGGRRDGPTTTSIFFDDDDEYHRSDDDASEEEDEGQELASWRPKTNTSSWDARDADRPREPLPMERPGAGPGAGIGAGPGPGPGAGSGSRSAGSAISSASDPWRREASRGAGVSTTEETEMRAMGPTPEEVRPRLSAFEPTPAWRTRFVSPSPGGTSGGSPGAPGARGAGLSGAGPGAHASAATGPNSSPPTSPSRRRSRSVEDDAEVEETDGDAEATDRWAEGVDDAAEKANAAAAAAAAAAAEFSVAPASPPRARSTSSPRSTHSWPITNGEQHVLRWETDLLATLGSDMRKFEGLGIAEDIGSAALSSAATAVLATAMLPVTALQSVSCLDDPWSVVASRVDEAGEQLAEVLLSRVHGERPVTLVGYSMGARLIFHALTYMAEHHPEDARGVVDDVVLLGGTMSDDAKAWAKVRSVTCGRLVNGHCDGDWLLALLYRYKSWNLGVAGLGPVECAGVENVDLREVIASHTDYGAPGCVTRCLELCGFEGDGRGFLKK